MPLSNQRKPLPRQISKSTLLFIEAIIQSPLFEVPRNRTIACRLLQYARRFWCSYLVFLFGL